jgi:ABC-2 type transport system permease protein
MNAHMKTFTWLVKREFWEHKGMLIWAPICVAALIVFFLIATTVLMASSDVENFQLSIKDNTYGPSLIVGSKDVLTDALKHTQKLEATQSNATSVFGFVVPLFVLLAFTIFFYCLQSLFDERKDRSILFWKSLPVSDTKTVLAKVFTATVTAPFINLCVGLGTSLLIALFFAVAGPLLGQLSIWSALSQSEFLMMPLYFMAVLPVFTCWALPTVGWLMLVSVVARQSPFVWAVAIPILIGVVALWLNQFGNFNWDIKWVWVNIVGRTLGAVMPGAWLWPDNPSALFNPGTPGIMRQLVQVAWAQFQTTTMWLGALSGLVMIYLAVHVRRWKDEG